MSEPTPLPQSPDPIAPTAGLATRVFPVGRSFIHPAVDFLLIGGGLSLLVIPFLPDFDTTSMNSHGALIISSAILFSNSAHFAGSTVRLYSKQGMFSHNPFYTMVFPAVSLALVTVCLVFANSLGEALYRLYLTWSPYHYAAQAYGLAAMYGHRSGCKLDRTDMRLLRWTAMAPFIHAFFYADTAGFAWFVGDDVFRHFPILLDAREMLTDGLRVLTFVMPIALVARVARGGRKGLPLISLAILVSNGVWWVVFEYVNAFAWATIFHGIQYLVILMVFHVRDHVAEDAGRAARAFAAVKFYAACLVLGYALFQVLPYAYVLAGFPLASSMMVIAAMINIHHFMVDGVIWRVRKDANYKIVVN